MDGFGDVAENKTAQMVNWKMREKKISKQNNRDKNKENNRKYLWHKAKFSNIQGIL